MVIISVSLVVPWSTSLFQIAGLLDVLGFRVTLCMYDTNVSSVGKILNFSVNKTFARIFLVYYTFEFRGYHILIIFTQFHFMAVENRNAIELPSSRSVTGITIDILSPNFLTNSNPVNDMFCKISPM